MLVYNQESLRKHKVIEQATRWAKSKVISSWQFQKIEEKYESPFYHPPIWLRVILFLATFLGVWAVFGFFVFTTVVSSDAGEETIRVLMGAVGIGCIVLLEYYTSTNKSHYKSGVTEALMFLGFGFLLGGILGYEASEYSYSFAIMITGIILFIRYSNLFGSLIALAGLGSVVFLLADQNGTNALAFLPFIFFFVFTGLYLMRLKLKSQIKWWYRDCITVLDSALLVLIYLSLNYFVVRELSSELLGIRVSDGEDIPFAFLFYFATVIIPIIYLITGIRKKNILFIRVGVLLIFASVITFKIYYSSGHPEITLTLAGTVITSFTLWLLNKLKTPKNGFTRDQLLTQEGLNAHTESLLVSSTMGGNASNTELPNNPEMGGGQFGGGGAGSDY